MPHFRRLLAALAWVSAMICTSACVHSTSANPAPSPRAAEGCANLGGTVGPDQTCHVKSAGSGYSADISYPLDYPDQTAVAEFVKRQRDQFANYGARGGAASSPPMPYSLEITAEEYRSGTVNLGTQSLVLTINDNTGAAHEAHPAIRYQAFNYDLGKRAPITFDTLFGPSSVRVLFPLLEPQLAERWGPAAPKALQDSGTKNYRNFAITDDAVTFLFGEDQLIPQNDGPLRVVVPLDQLRSVLH